MTSGQVIRTVLIMFLVVKFHLLGILMVIIGFGIWLLLENTKIKKEFGE